MTEGQQPPPPEAGTKTTAVATPTSGVTPAEPPSPQVFPLREDKPIATWTEVGLIVAAGFMGNLALRSSIATAAASMAIILVIAALFASGRVFQKGTLGFVLLAAILMPWLTIRADPSLTAVTTAMIVVLLAIAAGITMHGSVFNSSVREHASHVGSIVYEWIYGFAMVQRLVALATKDQRATPLLRGIAVAVPVLIVFTTLLASADEVFARFLLIGNLPSLIGHLVLTAVVAGGLFVFVSRSAHETRAPSDPVNIRLLGPVEITMILGGLVLLFGAFVATQVVVAAGGASHVLETEGLTQADHARRGFFQLLWVAGLAVALVGTLRAVRVQDPERGTDRFTPLALVTLVLTLVIAAVSIQRLSLYIGSFGLTPLRVWALAGAGAVAVAIALFAASIAGVRADRSWYPGAVLMLAFALVLGLNVANPDRIVAEYNMHHSAELDTYALSKLSDDAVTSIISELDTLPQAQRADVTSRLCVRLDRQTNYGFLEYNRSSSSADAALDALCGTRPTLGD